MTFGNVTCRWAIPRLPLLAGGELRGLERLGVERHARGCPTCRARLDGLDRAVGLLRDAGQEAAEAATVSLWPALRRQIAESRREPSSKTARAWLKAMPRRARIGLAAGLLVAVGVLGLWATFRRYEVKMDIVFNEKPTASSRPLGDSAAVRPRRIGGISLSTDAILPPPSRTRERPSRRSAPEPDRREVNSYPDFESTR